MKQIIIHGYKINIYRDIEEWGMEFYGMKDGDVIDNIKEVSSECMGFACPADAWVSIFIPKYFNGDELKATVAHEIGHLTPIFDEDMSKTEEQRAEDKANHYEAFYMLIEDVLDGIYDVNEQIELSKLLK